MHPVAALTRLGGVGDRATLLRVCTRTALGRAVRQGEVRRVGKGRYALPTADQGLIAAARLNGAASHLNAAAAHGWEIARLPDMPMVVVPRNRKVELTRRNGVDLRWRPLAGSELRDRVTDQLRTVLDCARDLSFADALAVADSALRHGDLDQDRMVDEVMSMPPRGRDAMLKVVTHASPLAANPFESVLRAIALDVPGLEVAPQVWIEDRGFRGRPDVVVVRRKLVLEADSHTFHTSRKAFAKDCDRYNALVIRGWTVLRFSWEQVMFEPDRVRDVLIAIVDPGSPLLTTSLLCAG